MSVLESTESSSSLPVSIVIPAYNYAKYLPEVIDSVLQQDYPTFEIIVVDDGSTDTTAAVVAGYGDKVRYIYQNNSGLPASRNTGIKAARYNYVGFVDADDKWLPSMLKRGMETFSKLSPDFAVVAFPHSYMDSEGKELGRGNYCPEPREISLRDIILKTRFGASNVIVKRAVFDECGFFDETLRSSEDRDMWIRIAAKRRLFMNSDRLVLVRRHQNSMSKHADRMKANIWRVIHKAYDSGMVPQGKKFFWAQVFSYCFFQNSWRYFYDEKRRAKALREIALSILICPYFWKPQQVDEPHFFRLRCLFHFGRELFGSRTAGS